MTRLLNHVVTAPSEERAREIEALGPWFHNLHLPDGSQTAPNHPLGDFPSDMWAALAPHLPPRLDGWRVLDIGCNSGFYTFKLAEQGATVVGIDTEPLFLKQAAWGAREFGVEDRVQFRRQQVYDLAQDDEQYDLVLFMGVFYHLRYPLLGLDIVARKVRQLLVFQTMTMPGMEVSSTQGSDRDIDEREQFTEPGWPRMAFIEHEFSGDITNWWAPNHAAVEAMLRSTGMRVLGHPGREMYLCQPDPLRSASAWPAGQGRAELLSATGRGWKDVEPA